MCAFGLALGPGRPNSHLCRGLWAMFFYSSQSICYELQLVFFQRLTLCLFFLGI